MKAKVQRIGFAMYSFLIVTGGFSAALWTRCIMPVFIHLLKRRFLLLHDDNTERKKDFSA
jgi:hypothetical protein